MIPHNYVRIKLDEDFTSYGILDIKDNYEAISHMTCTGIVTEVPEKLICEHERYARLNSSKSCEIVNTQCRQINATSLEWLPHDIEIKIGDRVLFSPYHVFNKRKYVDDLKEITLKYTDVYAILQDGNPTPINGYLFIEPILETESMAGFVYDKNNSTALGRVVFKSEHMNKAYLDNRKRKEKDVAIGDNLIFMNRFFKPTNHPTHPVINGYNQLYAVHRWAVIGKII